MRMLSELILIALLATGALCSQCPNRNVFTPKLVRFCLRPQFLFEPSYPANSEMLCAFFCAKRGERCRGFDLTPDSVFGCQTFEFDRCSHKVNQNATCSRFEWAFVRKQAGLAEGQLCPDGYGNGFYGSAFKMIDVSSWTDGLNKCNSEPGLTKFADGIDRAEVNYIGSLRQVLSESSSFYLGGFRPSALTDGTWFWHDCNATLLAEVWGSNEPNEGVTHDRTDIWWSYPDAYGLDDEVESASYLTRALCECVIPFV